MKLLIIRHGDPDYVNDSLTEKGFKEAELLADRVCGLSVDYFYCSPLGRARATAAPTLKRLGKDAEILDWLREFPAHIINPADGGDSIPWDLMPSYWTKNSDFYDKEGWIKTELMQTGNVEPLYNEVCRNLDSLLETHGYKREGNIYKAVKPNNDTIAFFCHFGIECVLLSHLLGISPIVLWQGFVALPTSVTTLITEEREEGTAYFRCNSFGDLSHLYAANEPASFSARFCEQFSNKEERH